MARQGGRRRSGKAHGATAIDASMQNRLAQTGPRGLTHGRCVTHQVEHLETLLRSQGQGLAALQSEKSALMQDMEVANAKIQSLEAKLKSVEAERDQFKAESHSLKDQLEAALAATKQVQATKIVAVPAAQVYASEGGSCTDVALEPPQSVEMKEQQQQEAARGPASGSLRTYHLSEFVLCTEAPDLGDGAFGQVLKVQHAKLGTVAIKMAKNPKDAAQRRMMASDASMQQQAACQYVVKIFGVITEDGKPGDVIGIVMEYMNKGELSKAIREYHRGRMSYCEVRYLLRHVAQAIKAMHARGVVHRDLKPANVLLHRTRNKRLHVKITDFGCAVPLEACGHAIIDAPCGTHPYTPSEVAATSWEGVSYEVAITSKADIYSFGVLAWEMLSGYNAFKGSSREEVIGLVGSYHWQAQWMVDAEFPVSPAGGDELMQPSQEELDAFERSLEPCLPAEHKERLLRVARRFGCQLAEAVAQDVVPVEFEWYIPQSWNPGMKEMIASCLQPHPDSRPSAADVCESLEHWGM